MPARRITLKDIARQAGVSTGTVSMVLNNSALIAEATRQRVRQVMHDLGYVYDRGAGQLRSKRSRIIGVSVCDLVDPQVARLTTGLQEALQDLDLVLLLGDCAGSVARQLRFLQTLREYNVAGLLMMPAIGTSRRDLEQLAEWRLPVVQVGRCVRGVATDHVGTDNRCAAELATRHLLALGHERLACIGMDRRSTSARQFLAGYIDTLRRMGRKFAAELVIECSGTREAGFEAVSRLCGLPQPPSAVLCCNEALAFGAMLGLRRLGLEPGRDCSVIALDETSEAGLWAPALTTVAADVRGICHAAGQLLCSRIAEPDRPIRHVMLEPRLVERASCSQRIGEPSRRVG